MAQVPGGPPRGADQLVGDLVAQGSESLADYQAAIAFPADRIEKARLARHIIGCCNRKDGGYLLIGVEDRTFEPIGLTVEQLATWDAAAVNAAIARFASPPPVVTVSAGHLEDGEALVAVHAAPLTTQPLVCVESVRGETERDPQAKVILRQGALYIRLVARDHGGRRRRRRQPRKSYPSSSGSRQQRAPGRRESGGCRTEE